MVVLLDTCAYLLFLGLLGIAVAVDIRKREIPNWVIFSTVLLWVLWQCALFSIGEETEAIPQALSAAAVFAILLVSTFAAERLFKRYLFGGGDIKLVAVSTLFLGAHGMLLAVFFACMISLIYAIVKLPRGIPFAPCMLCGSLIALLI